MSEGVASSNISLHHSAGSEYHAVSTRDTDVSSEALLAQGLATSNHSSRNSVGGEHRAVSIRDTDVSSEALLSQQQGRNSQTGTMIEGRAASNASFHNSIGTEHSAAPMGDIDVSPRALLIPGPAPSNHMSHNSTSSEETAVAIEEISVSSDTLLVPDQGSDAPAKSKHEEKGYADTLSPEKQPSWVQRVLLDTWLPEIIIAVLSIACVIAILAVLLSFDKKQSPHLSYGITLNAVISILATTSRSMLLYVVAVSISQLKWSWYRKSRRLQDIQTFDDASRGPWGSLTLLFSLRVRPLASIGALITILALAFGPFVQQILTYPIREVPRTVAPPAIARAPTFMLPADADHFEIAVEAGIFSDAKQNDRQLSCPTGTCIWPEIQSVGWCSQCRDARLYVELVGCDIDAQLRESPSKDINSTICKLKYESRASTGEKFTGEKFLMSFSPYYRNTSYIDVTVDLVWETGGAGAEYSTIVTTTGETYFEAGDLGSVISLMHVNLDYVNSSGNLVGLRVAPAEECSLSICNAGYNFTVTNGSTIATLLNQDFGAIYNRRAIGEDSSDPQSSYFCPCGLSQGQFQHSWKESLASQLGGTGKATTFYTRGDYEIATPVYQMNFPMEWTNTANHFIASRGLEQTLQGVAASLSQLSLTASSTIDVDGTAWTTETYVSVRYEWLAFPFALVLSAVTLLLMAMGQSRYRKIKPWKSSILPLLYHKLEPDVRSAHPAPKRVSAMEKYARQVKVRSEYSPATGQTTLKRA